MQTATVRKVCIYFVIFLLSNTVWAQSKSVSIPNHKLNKIYQEQKRKNWCWAASISTLYAYYGFSVSQEMVVRTALNLEKSNNLPDSGANIKMISSCLNRVAYDKKGKRYKAIAKPLSKAPRAENLISEISKKHPILVAYYNCPAAGHAVLITGCTYRKTSNGYVITSITIRDPMPFSKFYYSLTPNQKNGEKIIRNTRRFAKSIERIWYVRIIEVKNEE